MSLEHKQFFTCWLPLNNLDFFHPSNDYNFENDKTSNNQQKLLNEGAVQRVISVLEKENNFKEKENTTSILFLNRLNNYFSDSKENQKNYLKNGSIKINKKNTDISYFKISIIYKDDISFDFTIDEYGFYFFESDNENFNKKIITEFFGGSFIYDSSREEYTDGIDKQLKKYDGIFTKNQLVLLLEGIMNCDLYYKYFFKLYDKKDKRTEEKSKLKINKKYSIDKFIDKVLVTKEDLKDKININNINFSKIKNQNIISRFYDLGYIKDLYNSYSNKFDDSISLQKEKEKRKIENYELTDTFWKNIDKNKEKIVEALLQDCIEKIAMQKFLIITEQRPYFQRIKLGVDTARSRMINKIMSLATDVPISQIHYDTDYADYQFSEDRLEAYTELLLSKVPQLNNINNMLKNSYYVKIGNITDIDTINEFETIETFSCYQSWYNTLKSIEKDLKSLSESHKILYDKKSLSELEEIKREETSRNDFKDVLSAGEQEKQMFSMSDSDKNYLTVIAFGLSLIAILAKIIDEPSYANIIWFFLVFLFFIGMWKFKLRMSTLLDRYMDKNKIRDVMQIIEYRYRTKVISSFKWEKEANKRNSIKGVSIFANKFKEYIFDNITEKDISIKKTIHRISHEHKKIFIKLYTLEDINGSNLFDIPIYSQKRDNFISFNEFCKKSNILEEKRLINLLNVKIYLIGTFDIRIHDENLHDVYIDTIKIYYSFNKPGIKDSEIKKIDELKLKIESNFFNLFIKNFLDGDNKIEQIIIN